MKKVLVIGGISAAVLIAVGVGIYFLMPHIPPKRSFYGVGLCAEVQDLVSDIATIEEYVKDDPALREDLGAKQELLDVKFQELVAKGEDCTGLLHTAYIYKRDDILHKLLELGIDVNGYDQFGATVLHRAAGNGDIEKLKLFIEYGANVNKLDMGGTPVIEAAVMGGADTVALLIENGVDIRQQNDFGMTPLHVAVLSNKEDVARLLLKNGVSVDVTDKFGRTPLFYTTYAFIGTEEIVKEDRRALAELLIAHKADVMKRDQFNETPLHAAALWGADPIVSILLARDADIEAQDARGFTPLFMAALGSGKMGASAFEVLRLHKARMDYVTQDGVTLLHVTTFPDIAKRLIENGISVNVRDKAGFTPLDYASTRELSNLYAVSYLGVIPYNIFRNDAMVAFLTEAGAVSGASK